MHQTEILVGIGTKKQTDYATALIDADIDKIVVFNSADISSHDATKITDADKLGKGHDFITETQTESFAVKRKFDFDANSLNLPWALGWMLGSVATSGSAAAGYSHVFKMSDPVATGRQNPVTSIIEKIGGFETRKVPSLAGGKLTLSGELEKRLKLVIDLMGSGKITTSGITAPTGAPYPTTYFINQMLKLEIGPTGGALADIADAWHGWSLEIDNNLQEKLGFFPGSGFNTPADTLSGAIGGRMEYGRRVATLKLDIRVKTGSTQHTELINSTLLAAKITATGAPIPGSTGPVASQFILDFPKYAYRTMEINTVGDGILKFDLAVDLFYATANLGPFVATVKNDVAAFLN